MRLHQHRKPDGHPQEIASFQAYPFHVECLAFSPDGKLLASGGRDGQLKLWDLRSSKNVFTIRAHSPTPHAAVGMVYSVAFSPDGKTLASCGEDWKIKLWGVATGNNTASIAANAEPPLLFSPDGKTLVSRYELFDLETRKAQQIRQGSKGFPWVTALDTEGKLLLASASSWPQTPCIWLWDAATGKKVVTCKGYDKELMRLAFSRDGKLLASAGYDQTVRLWDTATGKNIATFDKLPKWSSCILTFSPDGKVLAMGYGRNHRDSLIGSILLLDVPSGKILATLKGDSDAIICQVFSPNGRLLASGGIDGIIKIWRLPARYKAE